MSGTEPWMSANWDSFWSAGLSTDRCLCGRSSPRHDGHSRGGAAGVRKVPGHEIAEESDGERSCRSKLCREAPTRPSPRQRLQAERGRRDLPGFLVATLDDSELRLPRVRRPTYGVFDTK